MFFNSSGLNNLEGGVNLSWAKQQLHTQNLSNINTPGYKSKDLEFSQVLSSVNDLDAKDGVISIIGNIKTNDDLSILQDGNNVDAEYENIELYKSYVQYSMLLDKISGKFDNYSAVLNSNL